MSNQSLEDRIKDRIKDTIGDVITDEDLYKLIRQAVNEVFFQETKRTDPNDRYGSTKIVEVPLMYKLAKELMTERMERCLQVFLTEHKADVMKAIDDAVANGVSRALLRALDGVFSGIMFNMEQSFRQVLENFRLR